MSDSDTTERRLSRTAVQQAVYGIAHAVPGVEFLSARFDEHRFAPHVHPVFVVGTVKAGVCRIWHRGKSHIATVGDLILISPGDPHSAAAVGGGRWDYCAIYIGQPQLIVGPTATHGGEHTTRLRGVVGHAPDLARRLSALCSLLESDPFSPRAESEIVPLMRALFGRFGECVAPDADADASVTQRLAAARNYIDAHFTGGVSTETIAEVAGLSRFHLIRSFTRQFGMPPHTYHTHLRVARARELLRSGQRISDTAFQVGFADQSHLNRAFRRIVGVTPGAYARAVSRGIGGAARPAVGDRRARLVPAHTEYVLPMDR